MKTTALLLAALFLGDHTAHAEYSWQKPHAKVLPTGDLEWAPEPFVFEKGASVRYIDFDGGRDENDGQSPETAWKRHPLDPAATGNAKAGAGVHTYVFKRGVVYRGALKGRLVGEPGNPVRLTSDPAWGQGEAVICGSERVTGWKKTEGEQWTADLGFLPRCVWQVMDGKATRIALARTPNWTVSDPRDVMSEWYEWEQPQWWTNKNKITVKNKKMHLGIDRKHLTGKAEDYVGGLVWSEWGIVMGTPFPSTIEAFDAAQKGVGFQGFWYNDSGRIITGNRYFLEDKLNFLDAPGEFWFEKRGRRGRLHIRLPDDADPNTVQVEAARRVNLMDFAELRHVRISGLSFRFTNVFWNLTARQFVHRDVQPACIRLYGSGEDIRISHCRFEHVNKALRLKAISDDDSLDGVTIADNDIRYTDHGAIEVEDSSRWAKKDAPFGELGDVKIFRNRLLEVGRRAIRSDSSHALCVSFAETLEVAGNMLHRCYGSGIFCFGGKGSGQTRDRALTRMLIHHNKVTEPLLAANDWGGIETWQGGPTYVYSNISGDPGGYWNWASNRPGNARLGFAYYLDGAFKNYYFNNIAWGRDNDLKSKYCNRTAFYQAVPVVLNTFANNTAYKFADGSSWSPAGGRQFFLGNVWSSISNQVFLHGKQKEDRDAVYDHYPHETMAYSRNVFHDVPKTFGHLEGSGSGDADLEKFRSAAQGRKLLAADVGTIATENPLKDPENHDFRPSAGAGNAGVRLFVPWGLSRMVGEWNFRRNNADPTTLLDEHWYLAPHAVKRETYRNLPRFDLKGVNLAAESYTQGPLENWTAGALKLDGADQYLMLAKPKEAPTAPAETAQSDVMTQTPADWLEVTTPKAMAPGKPSKIVVRVKNPPEGQKLTVHLHWLKKAGWGGFNEMARPFSTPVKGEGPYTFTVTPKDKAGLDAFSLLMGLTPTGDWKDVTKKATLKVAAGQPAPTPSKEVPNPHNIDGSFLVETYFRTSDPDGNLVIKMEGKGYAVQVASGRLQVVLRDGASQVEARSPSQIADGAWHHVLVEVDRSAKAVRAYLDGKTLPMEQIGDFPKGALSNPEALLIGKDLAMEIEFLRIALGTLADAKTTIEELYAWQFDGPFLHDFRGKRRDFTKTAAGAIDLD